MTDTSKEAVEKALSDLWGNPMAVSEFVEVQETARALLSERDALRAQLQAARDEALEEAAEQAISNAGSWEDVEGDAAVVISEQIRALKSTSAEGEG